MPGLIGSAPIYLNGVLSLLFVFMLPGLACASVLRIPDFPQRWFVVLLVSLVASHLLVTLIAAFHLDPLLSCRVAVGIVIVVLVAAAVMWRLRANTAAAAERSTLTMSDLGWLLASLAALAVTYFNVWKHGVPNIFEGSDPLVSWNAWALLWAQGAFPDHAYGYPQMIPTLWATTYIFTGSPEQYFAFYIYIGLIVLPILLNAMVLGRMNWWYPLVSGFAFVWFIAEIRAPWLRSTLESAFPDWIAVVFASCGVVLFACNEPDGRFDQDKIVNALLALCLVSVAAAIKPLHGLLALAVLAGISVDAWKHLGAAERNRFLTGGLAILAIPAIGYAIYYAHLRNAGIPGFAVKPLLAERLAAALDLFNSNFTIAFRIMFVLGLLLCPFVKRLRWFALPLYIAIGAWANVTPYDLRNVLSFLLIGAFVPLYAAGRYWLGQRYDAKALPLGRQWPARDGLVAAVLALATLALTSPLAMSDRNLQQRFADDQLRIEAGPELNRKVGELLGRGCRVFTSTASIFHIVAFAPFKGQMEFFFYGLPLEESLTSRLRNSTGCTAIFYPPDLTHPSIRSLITDYRQARGLTLAMERNGMEVLVSPQ